MNSPTGAGRSDPATAPSAKPRPLVVITGVVICLTLVSNYEQFRVEAQSLSIYRSQSVFVPTQTQISGSDETAGKFAQNFPTVLLSAHERQLQQEL